MSNFDQYREMNPPLDDTDFLGESGDTDATPEALRERVRQLDQHAAELRAKLWTLTENRGRARGALAESIRLYQTRIPKLTPEQLARQYIASELARREANKHAPPPAPEPVANSHIDRMSSRRGDSNTFVQKHLRHGHRRNGLPASMRGTRLPRGQPI